jgi:hypothetical protein
MGWGLPRGPKPRHGLDQNATRHRQRSAPRPAP